MDVATLRKQLIKHEGKIPYAYPDSEGYSTIGVGRLIDQRKGGRLYDDEIEYLLNNDIRRTFESLDKNTPWWRTLTENRQLVMAGMCFNLGIVKFLEFKNTLKAIEEGRYDEASDHMQASKWYQQVGSRAVTLCNMMRAG